jgi:hypothetical protein
MSKESATAAPSIGVMPKVSKSDPDLNGSDSDSNNQGIRVRERGDLTFDTAGLDSHYQPIEKYEGLHRYDPKFDWEPEEERRVVRKVRSAPSHVHPIERPN